MKNNKTKNLKKIIIGAIIALFVGGTSPWWWDKYIDPPTVLPITTKKREIYKKGNETIEIEGVYIPPPSNNMSDSYIFKKIDLDSGKLTNSLNSDLGITLNVNKLLISINLKEGALIGKSETSFLNCKSLLKTNVDGKKFVINNKNVPTPYYCTETNNGRISQFKFTSINKYQTPAKNMYTIIINLKFITWKL